MKKILKRILLVIILAPIGLIGYALLHLYITDPVRFEIRSMMKEDKKILKLGKIVNEKRFISNTDSLKASKNEIGTYTDCRGGSEAIRLIERNHRIEALANQIKDCEKDCEDSEEDHQTFPWSDIALSLLKYPEHVEFDYDKCPDCGEERIKLFFRSPDWTWEKMCGSAGEMIICLHCKRQASFQCSSAN